MEIPRDTRPWPRTEQIAQKHSALLGAIQSLEAALFSPAPGREREWALQVGGRLREVHGELETHRREVEGSDGLYEQLETVMPRAATRIQYLKDTNQSLVDRVDLLIREVERISKSGSGAFMAVRSNCTLLLGEMRHQQAREVDLMFEAFDRDIGITD